MLTVDFSRLDLPPGSRVLDAGCGSGRHVSEAFRRSGVHVVGLDRNTDDVVTARNLLRIMDHEGEGGGGSWLALSGDVTRLPFEDGSFDLVICSEVLEHIPSDDRAIAELVRVLKPGKPLAVSVPRFFPEAVCWALSKAYRNEAGGHVRIYRKRGLLGQLESAGVRCIGTGWAHALHAPYWWLKCLVGPQNDKAWSVRLYHRFLVWDIVQRPWLTRTLDRLLNPLIAKSCVLYLLKTGDPHGGEGQR